MNQHMHTCLRTMFADFGYIVIHVIVIICEEYVFVKNVHS